LRNKKNVLSPQAADYFKKQASFYVCGSVRPLYRFLFKQLVYLIVKLFDKTGIINAGCRAGKAGIDLVDIALFINKQDGGKRQESI